MRGFTKLAEIGKRNSASDQKMLQTMHDNAVSLGASCGMGEARHPATIRPGVDAACVEAGMSFNDITELIQDAIEELYPGQVSVYVRDVYPDTVVFSIYPDSDYDALYRVAYTLSGGKVTLTGQPVEVEAVTTYVPEIEPSGVAESADLTGDLVPLTEKAVAKDGAIRIKVIQAGQGSSGYYPVDVLKRDGPNVFKAGLHMHLDHPSVSEESDRPERSVATLAGTLSSDAMWDEHGTAGPGLYADAKVRSDLAPLIEELAPHIGVSIRAMGKAGTRDIDGKKTRTIESIDTAKSVDFVTMAGAGGKVLDLMESARQRQTGGLPPSKEINEVDKAAFDKLTTDLTEAQSTIATLQAWKTDQEKRDADAKLLKEAHGIVTKALTETRLPNLVRERLAGSLTANATVKDGALDTAALTAAIEAAVKAATAELAEMSGGNPIVGMGSTPPKDEDVTAGLVESFMAAGHSKEIAERMAAL